MKPRNEFAEGVTCLLMSLQNGYSAHRGVCMEPLASRDVHPLVWISVSSAAPWARTGINTHGLCTSLCPSCIDREKRWTATERAFRRTVRGHDTATEPPKELSVVRNNKKKARSPEDTRNRVCGDEEEEEEEAGGMQRRDAGDGASSFRRRFHGCQQLIETGTKD
jgi:hypothetical protein